MKVFSQTRLAFDNTVLEEGSGLTVRPNFFTSFTINRDMKAPQPLATPAVFEPRAALEKLAGRFQQCLGPRRGRQRAGIYFTDAAENRIYRWNAADRKADVLATTTGPAPQVLGFVPPSAPAGGRDARPPAAARGVPHRPQAARSRREDPHRDRADAARHFAAAARRPALPAAG